MDHSIRLIAANFPPIAIPSMDGTFHPSMSPLLITTKATTTTAKDPAISTYYQYLTIVKDISLY